MSVRIKRLSADYEKVCLLFQGDARIRMVESHGKPPEHYILQYNVKSIQQDIGTQKLQWHHSFDVEITLPGAYPRTAPQCRMITPAFHPNIAPHAICIGDHWAAGESLAGLIVRIGEMLAYQSYNVKSPLNGQAAQWAEKNRARLPLDQFDFSTLLTKGESARAVEQAATGACANCGVSGEARHLQTCINGHVVCDACVVPCARCGNIMCMSCDLDKCQICGALTCARCHARCATCGVIACGEHAKRCRVCREIHCRNCLVECAVCGKHVCVNHIKKIRGTAGADYACTNCHTD